MHAKSGGSSGEPPDFLFIPAACRSRKDLPRSAGGGDRARNTGNRPRDAEDGATGTGAGRGCGTRKTRAWGAGRKTRNTWTRARARARAQGAGPRVRGAGRGCGTRKTRAWGAGRKTRNTWTRTRTRARARARGHGVQDAERRTQNTGYWPRAAEHGKRGHEVQKTEDAGVGRGTQNAERGTRKTWTRARARGAGDGRRGTGDGAQAPVHGTQRDRIRPARPRNNRPGPFTAGRHPPPGPIRRDLSRLDARRRDPQQPAGAIHSRAPSATGTCNNPPGPSTAGRLPPRAAATCRAYESESRRCRRARRTCCCRAAPRPT